MNMISGPGRSDSHNWGSSGRSTPIGEYFGVFPHLVRQYGFKGLVVLVVAALLAFAPLSCLYWFAELRLESPLAASYISPVRVRAGQWEEKQEQEEAGETALLQVICETTSFGVVQPLLTDDDPRHPREGQQGAWYANRERVYLRPAGTALPVPFALLGRPPVSVWLPAGDYEILVIHEAPGGEPRDDRRLRSFPYVSTYSECSLENKQKTVCRILLPHYGFEQGFEPAGNDPRAEISLAPLIAAWEAATPIPTPGGYVLTLAEPEIIHVAEHRGCTIDFNHLHGEPREWTREQLATVRDWLPKEASATRKKLDALVANLGWRDFFQGWYCYAAAGITGLVFTRWGALAILEPWRHGESFFDNLGLLLKIFGLAVAVWIVFQILTDSGGCSGPVRFRLR